MTDQELEKSISGIEDDWDFLDQTISKKIENVPENPAEEQGIPVESALDEVDDYVDDSYQEILKEKNIFSSEDQEEKNDKVTNMSEEVGTQMDPKDDNLLDFDSTLLDAASLADAELGGELFDDIDMVNDLLGDTQAESVLQEEVSSGVDLDDSDFTLDEFDALLGDMMLDEPGSIGNMMMDDMDSLDDLLGGNDEAEELEVNDMESMEAPLPKSTLDVYSDSLGAVSSLDDFSLEEEFNSLLPEEDQIKKADDKATLMKKMFANIEPEDPQAEIEAEKKRLAEAEEKKKQKAEEKRQKKEEKNKLAAEKKAERAEKKAEKSKQKAEAKAEALAKKQKEKEEFEKNYVPEGKINKKGASIVFATAAVIGIVVVAGSMRSNYKLIRNDAAKNLEIGRYKVAYTQLSGLNLKSKDKDLYYQAKTVMIMSKQQEAYKSFRELNMHVEALDSLLKGLERYDEYYTDASKYGVQSEYDEMKKEMLYEMRASYKVDEARAKELISEKDKTAYTKALTEICSGISSSNDKTIA